MYFDDIDIQREAAIRRDDLIKQSGIPFSAAIKLDRDTLKREYEIAVKYSDLPKGKLAVWIKGWKHYGRNPSMYSKTAVKSYGRGVTPKRSYKRNLVPGVTELATSLLSGEVMSRAKDWAKGKKSKLAKRLHNPESNEYIFNFVKNGRVDEVKEEFSSKLDATKYGKQLAKQYDTKVEMSWRHGPLHKKGMGHKQYRGGYVTISNPGSKEPISPEVEDMAKNWHGRDVGDVTEVEEVESFESDLVELGDLEELGILELGTISFKKDQPKLACDGEGHNLEIVGGDQELDLDGEGVEFKGKRLIPLGYLYSIVYVTDKHHLEGSNGYPEPYEHYFAEDFYKKALKIEDFNDDTDVWFETLEDMGVVQKAIEKGLLPTAVYDKTDGKILIAGGEYEVTELGIKD